MKELRLFWLGVILILAGGILAFLVHTDFGKVKVQDVRFTGPNGQEMSALLYRPATATNERPAPGILAVHGYINTRETHSGFAIEFARRGYVVLSLDQTGHGFSAAPAFSNGFGGPAGLAYLRNLGFVDTANIGLEGHSMGGWTVLAAAAASPDDYRSMVLEGSSTGAPFAQEGSTTWPRNLAVVFSKYDEFSQLMWQVDRAQDVNTSEKLQKVFGTSEPIVPGRIYGSVESGTARVLYQPNTTHPGDHISNAAIGDAVRWFQETLQGGNGLPPGSQTWFWKEIGTLIALAGFVLFLLGTAGLLLYTRAFSPLTTNRMERTVGLEQPGRTWLAGILMAAIPVLTYFPFFSLGTTLFPASAIFPQTITSQIMTWAVLNAIITILLGVLLFRGGRPTLRAVPLATAILYAMAVVAIGYLSLLVVDFLFKVDYRFWIFAFKPLTPVQARIMLVYLLPFTAFFLVALRALHTQIRVASSEGQYLASAGALAGGFLVFLAVQYAVLFATGKLLTPNEPLNTIVAMQFLPLLVIVALISTFIYRRTASYVPGGLLAGLLVTWYIVVGQATQFPV